MKKTTNSFADLPTRAVKPQEQIAKKRRAPIKPTEIAGAQFSTPSLASHAQVETFDTPGVKPVTLSEAQREYENIPGLVKNEYTMMGMKPVKKQIQQPPKAVTPVKKVAPKPQIYPNRQVKLLLSPKDKEEAMKNMKYTSRSYYQQNYLQNNNTNTNNNNMDKDWEAYNNTATQAIDTSNFDENTGCIQLLMDADELSMHQQSARFIQSRCKRTVQERRKMIKTIKKTNPTFIDNVKRYYAQQWLGTAVTVDDRDNVYIDEESFDYGDDPYHRAERLKIAQWELANDPNKYKYDYETDQFYTTTEVSQFESELAPEEMLDSHIDLKKRTKYDPLMECDDLLTSLSEKLTQKSGEDQTTLLAHSIVNLTGLFRRYVYETECRFMELEKRPIGVAAPAGTGSSAAPASTSSMPARPPHPLFGGGGPPGAPPRPNLLSGITGGIALKKTAAPGAGADGKAAPAAKTGGGGLDLSQMSKIKLRSAQDPLPIKPNQPQQTAPVFPTLRPSQPRNVDSTAAPLNNDRAGFTLPQLREGQQYNQQQPLQPSQPSQPSWMSLERLKSTAGPQQPVVNQPQLTATLAGLKKTGGVPTRLAPQPTQEVAEFQALFLRKTSTSAYIQHQRQQQLTTTSVPGVITFTSPRTRTMNKFNDQFKMDLMSNNNTTTTQVKPPTPQPPQPTQEDLEHAAELERIQLEEQALRIVQEKLAKEKKLLEMKVKYTYANIAQQEEIYSHPETRVHLTPVLNSKIPEALYEHQKLAWEQNVAFPLIIGKKKKSGKKKNKKVQNVGTKAQQVVLSLDQFHQAVVPALDNKNNSSVHLDDDDDDDDNCPIAEMAKMEREGSPPRFTTLSATTHHISPATSINLHSQANESVLPLTPVVGSNEQQKVEEMEVLSLTALTPTLVQPTTPTKSVINTSTTTTPLVVESPQSSSEVEIEDNLPLPTVAAAEQQEESDELEEEEEEEEEEEQEVTFIPMTPTLTTATPKPSQYGFLSPQPATTFNPTSTPTRRQQGNNNFTPKMAPRMSNMTPKMLNFNAMIAQPLSQQQNIIQGANPQRFKNVLGTPQMAQQRRLRDENMNARSSNGTPFVTPSKQQAFMFNTLTKPTNNNESSGEVINEPKQAFRNVK